jgi:hypothetical protein
MFVSPFSLAFVGSSAPMDVREFLAAIGKKGGEIGGKVAAKNMTKAQRSARAKKAAADECPSNSTPGDVRTSLKSPLL